MHRKLATNVALAVDGTRVDEEFYPPACNTITTSYATFTPPSDGIVVLAVSGPAKSPYEVGVNPAIQVQVPYPALVARLRPTAEPDDVQRVLVDGVTVAETRGAGSALIRIPDVAPEAWDSRALILVVPGAPTASRAVAQDSKYQ